MVAETALKQMATCRSSFLSNYQLTALSTVADEPCALERFIGIDTLTVVPLLSWLVMLILPPSLSTMTLSEYRSRPMPS